MPIHQGLSEAAPYRGCFLSIGNFDGVHRGHQAILSELANAAAKQGRQASVLTFEPHPIQLLRPEFVPPRLTTLNHKCDLILQAGIDHVVVYPTEKPLLELSAENFFEKIIQEHFQATGLVEGPNFYFGKDRGGNTETLQRLCQQASMELNILQPQLIDGRMISSSSIRESILAGKVDKVAEDLGRPYSIEGTIIKGEQRGRTLDYPTANLGNVETLIPGDGVYAARAIWNGESSLAAINIGPNPTFEQESSKVEAHLIGRNLDLYGKILTLEFIQRIREVRRFSSAEELKQQIEQDVAQAQKIGAIA